MLKLTTPICAAWLMHSRETHLPTSLPHRNISEKRCGWTRSSPLLGRCCHTLKRAATSQRLFSQRSPCVKKHGRQPKPRSLFSPISARPRSESTRLNSSHMSISYAVFCLKKKKKKYTYFSLKKKKTKQTHKKTTK